MNDRMNCRNVQGIVLAAMNMLRGRVLPVILFFVALSARADPAWWTNRNVVDEQSAPSDYAPAVLGQLKWFATNACDELEDDLPGGAGSEVWVLVQGFANDSNSCPANIGQLKATAEPFWDRLIAEGYTNDCPWTASATDDVDQAVATLGQLKTVFNFEFMGDVDADDLLDWWETYWFGSITNQAGSGDFDFDGLVNSNEYAYAGNPTQSDTDNDGVSDNDEATVYGSSLQNPDTDGDGLTDGEEVNTWGSSPTVPDSDSDEIADGAEVAGRTDPTNSDTVRPIVVIEWPRNYSEIMVQP